MLDIRDIKIKSGICQSIQSTNRDLHTLISGIIFMPNLPEAASIKNKPDPCFRHYQPSKGPNICFQQHQQE